MKAGTRVLIWHVNLERKDLATPLFFKRAEDKQAL